MRDSSTHPPKPMFQLSGIRCNGSLSGLRVVSGLGLQGRRVRRLRLLGVKVSGLEFRSRLSGKAFMGFGFRTSNYEQLENRHMVDPSGRSEPPKGVRLI